MDSDYFAFACIFVIMIIGIKVVVESDFFQLRCIDSKVDGNTYCVRERNKLEMAVDKLARVRANMDALVKKCNETRPDAPEIKRLVKNYNPKKICETLPSSKHTAYSENKGEKIAFCLDTERNNKGQLIDINTLTFVAIHELGHVASASIGHTPEYWANFKMLLTVAVEEGLYEPVDYAKNPQRYCGMDITDSPIFDM
tara:strand:- start:1816 stop:2409 length:594 start_codon:yes stop_codon:yes gene_type:complete